MKKTLLTLALLGLVTSCSSTRYGDPNQVETVNIDYGLSDLQSLAGGMVDSLIQAPQLTYYPPKAANGDPRIVVLMGGVENRTYEHIDTRAIIDSMEAKLLNSGKFRFVAADQGQGEIGDQVRFQQESGRVNPETAKAFGSQVGADMILYGTLYAYDKRSGGRLGNLGTKTQNVDYQFVLELTDITTAELVWKAEELVRKTKKTGVFG
jgi:uncharacterized protein (TIGR02722 family)